MTFIVPSPACVGEGRGERPRIISDHGPQFIAKDFKEFVRLTDITHVRTSPYHPQSNGKRERWHGSLKGERFRLAAPTSVEAARRVVASFVAHYNDVRLHSAIGYITPTDKLTRLEEVIFAERDRKLEGVRKSVRLEKGLEQITAAVINSSDTFYSPSRRQCQRT